MEAVEIMVRCWWRYDEDGDDGIGSWLQKVMAREDDGEGEACVGFIGWRDEDVEVGFSS